MRPYPLAFVLLPLALLAAGPSPAATPLPFPPFTGGGFVPPTKDALRQEVSVLKVLAKYAYKRSSCDSALLDDLTLAYTSASGTKITAVQEKWVECVGKVDTRYLYDRDKVLLKGTPACLDGPAIDALRAQIDGLLAASNAIALCDDDGAAPDPVTSLDVPDKVKEADGETEAAARIAKSYQEAVKCLAYVLPRMFREQAVSSDNVLRYTICLDKSAARTTSAADDLEQTQQLPDCLPKADLVTAAIMARDFGAASSGAIFCASPGGAFVDGVPLL